MKRLIVAFLALISLSQAKAACDDMTIVANGCFLEVYCVQGAVSTLEASLHLNSLTYTQRGSTTFNLTDNGDRAFSGDVNKMAAYATVADVFLFLDPLRAACQGGGGGGGTVTATTTDFEYIERCDDNGGVLTPFLYKISKTGTAADVITTVNADGTPYTITGVVGICSSTGCTSSNEQGALLLVNGTFTFTADTYHSISYVVEGGTVNVSVNGGPNISRSAGESGSTWTAKECEFLAYEVVFDATGGGQIHVNFIQ